MTSKRELSLPKALCEPTSRPSVARRQVSRELQAPVSVDLLRQVRSAVVGKQSKKTLFDIFGHYIEGYMTPFDTIWNVK